MRWELPDLLEELDGLCAAVPEDASVTGMTWPRATRNLKHAEAGQLTAMQDAAAVLLEHERHISPDVITALCQIREETAAELKAREGHQQTSSRQHLRTILLPGQQVS